MENVVLPYILTPSCGCLAKHSCVFHTALAKGHFVNGFPIDGRKEFLEIGPFRKMAKTFFPIFFINFCPVLNDKWPNFWYFEVLISTKCVYMIYLGYSIFF